MPYTAPELDALLQNIPTKDSLPQETLAYLKLADQLTILIEFIAAQKKSNHNDSELLASLIGAHIFCLEMINQEYYLHSPELKKGYIYDSGSPLYSFITKGLNISAENPLMPRDKLIFLTKFHQFITRHSAELETLQPTPIVIKELQLKIEKLLENCLSILTTHIANIVNAVPTEKSISAHMEKLPDNYKERKEKAKSTSWFSFFNEENPKRIVLAQLAQLISTIKCEDESLLSDDEMTRSQRIKLGMLLFITKSLSNECWFFSPKSDLYDESKNILNSTIKDNLSPQQTLACLSAFRNLISAPEERSKLEQAAREYFKEKNLLKNIDIELNKICEEVSKMEKAIDLGNSNWPATKMLGSAGVLLGAAPGYGLGTALGYTVGETENTQLAKSAVGSAVTSVGKAFFLSNSIGYFSFYMGDFLIKSTLTRAFAKLFELAGMAMVGGAGVLIGVTIDLSYLGLRAACNHFLNYCKENPTLMRNADQELINCLLDLPSHLFSEEKHHKITYAQGSTCTLKNSMAM